MTARWTSTTATRISARAAWPKKMGARRKLEATTKRRRFMRRPRSQMARTGQAKVGPKTDGDSKYQRAFTPSSGNPVADRGRAHAGRDVCGHRSRGKRAWARGGVVWHPAWIRETLACGYTRPSSLFWGGRPGGNDESRVVFCYEPFCCSRAGVGDRRGLGVERVRVGEQQPLLLRRHGLLPVRRPRLLFCGPAGEGPVHERQ